MHFGDCENNPLPLTDNDLKLLKKMIERPQFNQLPNSYQNRRFGQWKQGLEMMVKFGSKYEIENLLAIGSLTDYVNFKLENGAWI